MPICDQCKYEADNPTRRDFFKEALQKWHNFGAEKPPFGHAACKGETYCCCQHKPHGAWRGVAEDE